MYQIIKLIIWKKNMNKEEAEKLYGLLKDLGWEYERMSTDGQVTLNEIYDMVGIEPMEDGTDIDLMMTKIRNRYD